MTKPGKVGVDRATLAWAVEELRELDALCRSQVQYYDSFDSADMDRLHLLEKLVKRGDSKVGK